MDIVAFTGCAVVICVLAVVVRGQKPEMGTVVTVAAGVVMLAAVMSSLIPAVQTIGEIISSTDAAEYFGVVLKLLGVCLVTRIGADICRDAGQSTIASHVEMAGRTAMLILALPLLSSVLSVSLDVING